MPRRDSIPIVPLRGATREVGRVVGTGRSVTEPTERKGRWAPAQVYEQRVLDGIRARRDSARELGRQTRDELRRGIITEGQAARRRFGIPRANGFRDAFDSAFGRRLALANFDGTKRSEETA